MSEDPRSTQDESYRLEKVRHDRYEDELGHALRSIVWTTYGELNRELQKIIEKQKTREEATYVAAAAVAWLLREGSRPNLVGQERADAMQTAAFALCGGLSYYAHRRRDAREMKRIAAPVHKEK